MKIRAFVERLFHWLNFIDIKMLKNYNNLSKIKGERL